MAVHRLLELRKKKINYEMNTLNFQWNRGPISMPRSKRNYQTQMNLHAVETWARYSALAEELETVVYFLPF